MRVITKTVYDFDELNEAAKQRAIENQRKSFYYFWSDENIATLKAFGEIFPIKIIDWEYGDKNFVNFEMQCTYEIERLSGVRLLSYITNNYYNSLWKGKYYSNGINLSRHSKIIMENSCTLTGYHMDDAILKPIYDFMKNPTDCTDFEDLMEECLYSWVHACRDDYEHAVSDEGIIESIKCNEYEFDENGEQQ